MTILKQRSSGWLMKKVEKELEKIANEASAMLDAWKDGYTEMEFRLMNGEDLKDRNGRDRIPNHCPKHDLWERTIIAHEQQFQNLDEYGMPMRDCLEGRSVAEQMSNMSGKEIAGKMDEWSVFALAHKPTGCFFLRNMVLYSNGIMSSGHYNGQTKGDYHTSSSGAWIPYWAKRDSKYPPMYVEDYESHINKFYQEAVDWIEEKFAEKPKVKKRMRDSLDEQMNHDKFRGLHWRN